MNFAEELINYAEKLKDKDQRQREVGKWRMRFKKIRKKEPKRSIAKICADYKLDDSQICHQVAGRRGASWDHIHAVNRALDAEFKRLGIKKGNAKVKKNDGRENPVHK